MGVCSFWAQVYNMFADRYPELVYENELADAAGAMSLCVCDDEAPGPMACTKGDWGLSAETGRCQRLSY
jgi:hypothetical protein